MLKRKMDHQYSTAPHLQFIVSSTNCYTVDGQDFYMDQKTEKMCTVDLVNLKVTEETDLSEMMAEVYGFGGEEGEKPTEE